MELITSSIENKEINSYTYLNIMHKYGKGLAFYYVPKELFDRLLDLVKQYDIKEYEKAEENEFTSIYLHWNEKGINAIKEQIKFLERLCKK